MAKEKDKIVKTTKEYTIISHPVYSDEKLIGWTQSTLFRDTPEGLVAFTASVTKETMLMVNRQIKTDDKNNFRRGTSIFAALKALAKVNPTVAKIVELLAKQTASGKFDIKMLEAIEKQLTIPDKK